MQREEPPVMTTGLERIAVKARCEPKLRFTSLAHHITKERVWESLSQIPAKSAAGVDGQTVTEPILLPSNRGQLLRRRPSAISVQRDSGGSHPDCHTGSQ
jgi:hypothetical protein